MAAAGPSPSLEHVRNVRVKADALAAALVDATDAGVSGAVILPQLIAAFKGAFGGDVPPEALRMLTAAGAST